MAAHRYLSVTLPGCWGGGGEGERGIRGPKGMLASIVTCEIG